MSGFLNAFAFGVVTPPGQYAYSANATLIVPAGVTSMSLGVETQGGSANTNGASFMSSGGGGASAWTQAAVTPGESLSVVLPTTPGGDCGYKRGATWLLRATNANQHIPGAVIIGTGYGGGAGVLDEIYDEGFAYGGGGAGRRTQTGPDGAAGSASGGTGTSLADFSTTSESGLNGGTLGGGAAIVGSFLGVPGACGARALWGDGRFFPNTNTADV